MTNSGWLDLEKKRQKLNQLPGQSARRTSMGHQCLFAGRGIERIRLRRGIGLASGTSPAPDGTGVRQLRWQNDL